MQVRQIFPSQKVYKKFNRTPEAIIRVNTRNKQIYMQTFTELRLEKLIIFGKQ